MRKTQNEKLLNALQKGPITSARAKSRFGVARLSARIYDLRQLGYKIKAEYNVKNGHRVASYSLPATRSR